MANTPNESGSISDTVLTGTERVDINQGPVWVNTTTQAIANLSIGTASGTFTLNGTTPVTVAQTATTANSVVAITLKTVGGTVGAVPAIQTITAGTGFTVAGTALDTSVYNYRVFG